MTSPNLQSLIYGAAPEAHFDQLERDLVALTTATLDEDELAPAQVVDEFATEFLLELTKPPKGAGSQQSQLRRPRAGGDPC
jgi:hypothetical protein